MDKLALKRLREINGIGPKRYASIISTLQARNLGLSDLFTMPVSKIKADFGLPTNVARAIAQSSAPISQEIVETRKKLLAIKGVGRKRLEQLEEKFKEIERPLTDIFSMSSEELLTLGSLPKNVVKSIATSENKTVDQDKQQLDKSLEVKGIGVLSIASEEYPQRLKNMLGDKAPDTLYYWGNLELLTKPAVGFCGSRKTTDKGLQVTSDTAEQIAEKGWVVVSGHARGVDSTAHKTALEKGGNTIIVLPEGFNNFSLRRELKDIAKPEQLLIISEYPPNAIWTSWRAMQRNKTIIGLSNAMVLVQAGMKGGTFAAGKESLKYKVPLFVALYQNHGEESEGNLYFLSRGATPLQKSKSTGRANISSLVEAVTNANEVTSKDSAVQTTLFELEKS